MGKKLSTVIFNYNLVSQEEISQKLLDHVKNLTKTALLESGHDVPVKLPSVHGSFFLEFPERHHKYPMQMVFQNAYERYARTFFTTEVLARELSIIFPNTPFIYLVFNSVVDTGYSYVYENGKEVRSSHGKEGDDNKNIGAIFQKYFGIPYKKNKAWRIISKWSDNAFDKSEFSVSSYSNLGFMRNHQKDEEDRLDDFYAMEWNAIEIFKTNPEITQEDYKKVEVKKVSYDMAKYLYEGYLNSLDGGTTKMFALTEGHLFRPEGLFFLDEVKEITPLEWFTWQEDSREDLERRKNEKLGPKPASYYLTEDELSTMSYDEQKQEAYNRYQIAKKRGDISFYSYYNENYAKGIKMQSNAVKGDYIKVKDEYARVKFTRFKSDDEKKTFIETANVYVKTNNGYKMLIVNINDFEKVLLEEVPEEYLITDEYLEKI